MNAVTSGAFPRVVAARAVDQVLTQGRNLDVALANSGLEKLTDRDKPLATALAYGAVRTHLRNRCIIDELATRPFRNRDQIIIALLSVGLFALLESRRPDYAVVSSTVAAVSQLGRPQLKGVVNAILRRFLRERDSLMEKIDSNPVAHWQHPEWLIETIRTDWPNDWQYILEAGNRQAPMWLRLNLNLSTRPAWAENFAGSVARMPVEVPTAVMLTEPVPVSELPGFATGVCSVQDVASQLAAIFLRPTAGMRVLDACSAPGGKALHILEACPDVAELVALDESPERLLRVQENFARANQQATIVCGDAAEPATWFSGRLFDRILVDAPCSATGVLRRHPDIRFLRRPGDIAELTRKQEGLLQALWPLLAPGGRILYATCSVLRAENDVVIRRFLSVTDDANELPLEVRGAETDGIEALAPLQSAILAHGFQLLPGRMDNDGFYYALIEKQAVAQELQAGPE